jgi:hypothetical protein
LAILRVVEAAVGIGRKDLIVETRRLIGFDRTGTDLQAAIDQQIAALLETRRLVSDGDHIRLVFDHSPSVPVAQATVASLL